MLHCVFGSGKRVVYSFSAVTNPDTVCVVSMQQILDLAVEEPVLSCDGVRHQVFEIAEVLASVSQISEESIGFGPQSGTSENV